MLGAGMTIGIAPVNSQPTLRTLPIVYVEVEDDARYEPLKAGERIVLRAPHRPYHGAAVAIDDASALTRVTGVALKLERVTAEAGKVAAAVTEARKKHDAALFLLDLPAAAFASVAAALKGQDVIAFNVTAPEDELRRTLCAREIVHTVPSQSMRMDALVQYLIGRKWRDILVLEGPEPEDAAMSAALLRSAKKFGARIAAHQRFKLGNDPRDRELNNPALLTAINRDYDVVFVADRDLEMARQVSYRTVRARPVVGSIDLEPEAWHWTWDRHGGPQLSGALPVEVAGSQDGNQRLGGVDCRQARLGSGAAHPQCRDCSSAAAHADAGRGRADLRDRWSEEPCRQRAAVGSSVAPADAVDDAAVGRRHGADRWVPASDEPARYAGRRRRRNALQAGQERTVSVETRARYVEIARR